MDLTIRAIIQVVSSGLVPSAPFPVLGGWKATILPSCRGSCLSSVSRSVRDLVSRSVGVDGCGPADPRWVGPVALRALPADAGVGGADDGSGECARGRLSRFSMEEQFALRPSPTRSLAYLVEWLRKLSVRRVVPRAAQAPHRWL
jgi:hypothetical protein